MANRMYLRGRQAFLEGSIAILSDNIKASLVNATTYSAVDTTTDQFFSTIPSTVADSANLASKTSGVPQYGTFDAADLTWTSVTGSVANYVVLWKDTGTPSTCPLICLFDTGANLPVTPIGGDITAQWSSGTDRIFTLCESLSEEEKITLWSLLKKWARKWGGMGLEMSKDGLYLPQIKMVVHPPRIVLAS